MRLDMTKEYKEKPPAKKYKWLLFDADDTLLDFFRAEHDALCETLIEAGLPADGEAVSVYSGINDALWKSLERGEVTKDRLRYLRFARFIETYGYNADARALADSYEHHLAGKSYLLPGAEQTCRALFGKYKMYIITNGIVFIQKSRFGACAVHDLFERSFISDEIGVQKPARGFFDAVAAGIVDFDPQKALVIGDSLTSDIKGGIGYGLDTCWINRYGRPVPEDMDITYVINDISELPALLEGKNEEDRMAEYAEHNMNNINMPLADGLAGVLRELDRAGVEYEENASLAARTSFRIGGCADAAVFPADEEEAKLTYSLLRREKVRYMTAGNGTNLLFADGGYRGAVVFTSKMKNITADPENFTVTAGSGASLTLTAAAARDAGLAGLEFAFGIPGSVGGAVTMNAGAYGGQMSDVLTECRLLDTVTGEILTLPAAALDLSYRHSIVKDHPEYAVLSAKMKLRAGNKEEIAGKMNELMERRRDKQPLEYPSAGSVFKRPAPDMYVGKMVEESGLKGASVGGAKVSPKHAGFIVNAGGATAADVGGLVELVKETVRKKYGVELECEICFVPEK